MIETHPWGPGLVPLPVSRTVFSQRLLKDGEYGRGLMSVAEARKAHADALAQVSDARRGDAADPASQRDVKNAEPKLGESVADFAALYMKLYAKREKRSWATDERILNRDVLPYIGSFKLKDLTQMLCCFAGLAVGLSTANSAVS